MHGDDTTVPVLAKGKTITGRLWVYVRDDRPFGRARSAGGGVLPLLPRPGGEHPEHHLAGYAGILQADAYAGFNRLYAADRARPGRSRRRAGRMPDASSSSSPTSPQRRVASCPSSPRWPSRRSSASTRSSPIEREINGRSAEARLAVRERIAPGA